MPRRPVWLHVSVVIGLSWAIGCRTETSGVTERPVAGSTGSTGSVATSDPSTVSSPMEDAPGPADSGTTIDGTTGDTAVEQTPAAGALFTPTGVLTPIRAVRSDGRSVVGTPCGNEHVLDGGRRAAPVQVLLDPGHGGKESGAVGPNGLREATVNLDVARRVERWLRSNRVTVELTRRTDDQVTLAARAELARAMAPRILVSIHHNGGGILPSDEPGTLALHQLESSDSRRLAGILFEELDRALTPLDLDWVKDDEPGAVAVRNEEGNDYYAMLRETQDVPSVIIEPMFLTSSDESTALQQDDVRTLEAETIGRSIVRFLRTNATGSGFRAPRSLGPDDTPSEPEGCTDPPLE